jgi:hypothetical protein
MFHLFLLPLIVFGDMCQDFCIVQLGQETCHKGSYCKKNYDCHNLFWTSEERTGICVFTGRGECTNRYPVLCLEADTSRIRPHVPTSTIAPTTTSMPTSQPGFLRRMFTRFFPPTRATQSAQQQLGDNVIALEVHFLSTTNFRSHPYIKLSFEKEGRNLGYFAVFDTGSEKTYILAETEATHFSQSDVPWEPRIFRQGIGEPIDRPADEGEGYRLSRNQVPRNPQTLAYGEDGAHRFFESFGTINDTVTVFSGASNQFTFHAPEIHLVRPPGDRFRALLGAQPGSAFGTAAEVFAVVPSPPYSFVDSDWQLLIGLNSSNRAQVYCSPDDPTLRWFPQIGSFWWKIQGRMWLARGGPSRMSRESTVMENIEMVLDTGGTDRIHLSPLMMDVVIAELESFGPRRIPSEGQYPRFTNCTNALRRNGQVLGLRIQPGTQRSTLDPLSLEFPIINHLEFDEHITGECTLMWKVGTTGAPNTVLIGTAYLSKMVTVFDSLHDSIGLCRRGYNAIQH